MPATTNPACTRDVSLGTSKEILNIHYSAIYSANSATKTCRVAFGSHAVSRSEQCLGATAILVEERYQ
jgi:hypothetical protein